MVDLLSYEEAEVNSRISIFNQFAQASKSWPNREKTQAEFAQNLIGFKLHHLKTDFKIEVYPAKQTLNFRDLSCGCSRTNTIKRSQY